MTRREAALEFIVQGDGIREQVAAGIEPKPRQWNRLAENRAEYDRLSVPAQRRAES